MSVYEYRKKWRYEFKRKGRRIQGWWYETQKEAQLAQAEAVRLYEQTQAINTGFSNLCSARLAALTGLSQSHQQRNRQLFDILKKHWGRKKTVTRQDVANYLAAVAKNRSHSLANRHLRLIRALFRYGLELGIWTINPTQGIKQLPGAEARRYVPPLEDVRKVLDAASPRQRAYLTVIIHTLARVNAINVLKWEDVHSDFLILRTRKAKDSKEKQIRIPLSPTLKDTLSNIPRNTEYVFGNPKTGRPYKVRLKLIHGLCEKAGIKPHFTFHALRHFSASYLVQQGVALTDVQLLLGHERATTTSIYLRVLGNSTREAVQRLEGI